MARRRKDEVVRDADWNRFWQDDIEVQKRVDATLATNVQVEIDAAIVMQNKVAL